MLAKKAKKRKRPLTVDKDKLSIIVWGIFCLVFIGYLGFCNVRIWEKRHDLSKSSEKLEENIGALTKEKETLSFNLGETYSENYIEKVAREDLGMQKSGEEVVVVKKDGNTSSPESSANNNLWHKFLNWFDSLKKNIF